MKWQANVRPCFNQLVERLSTLAVFFTVVGLGKKDQALTTKASKLFYALSSAL